MLLIYILAILADATTETRMYEAGSLLPPFVALNGVSESFLFEGQYLLKTRSRSDVVQLGYNSRNSTGLLKTKEPIKVKDFSFSIDFSLNFVSQGGKNAGFGFWLIQNPQNIKGFYGNSPNFKGIGVVIDIEGGTPYIRFIDSSASKHQSKALRSEAKALNLKFERKDKKILVKFEEYDKEHVLFSGEVKIPKELYFAVTSFSGKSEAFISINRIVANKILTMNKKIYVKGGKRKLSSVVLVLGSVTILGLVYYLYSKAPKEMAYKN